jgi:uncharacterized protein (DUF2267 family)
LRFEDFIRRVGARAQIADRFEAEKTAVVVLQTLCDRLTGKEANDMLSQLPSMFRELIVVIPSPLRLDVDGFVDRVAHELGVEAGEARKRTEAVLATLREAITVGELRDIVQELDPDYVDLLLADA